MIVRQEKIGVVGAGLMGAEIALVFAVAGHAVVLSDQSEERLAAARARLDSILDRGIPRGFFAENDRDAAPARIATSISLDAFAECDFVTEAVFEDEAVKAEIYRTLDRVCAPETLETALRLCRDAGKVAIPVKDVAGFAVNRMLLAFLNEAVRLVDEGVATPADIDAACRLGLGHPMGPFELMDATTSKLCLQASEILFEAYGERFRPPALLKQRVRAGYVGGRGSKGWRSK